MAIEWDRYAVPRWKFEIEDLVKDVETTAAWRSLYIAEARRLKAAHPQATRLSYQSALEEFALRAISSRAEQMKEGSRMYFSRQLAAAAGTFPGGKALAIPGLVTAFNKALVRKFGLASQRDLKKLFEESCRAGGVVTTLPEAIQKICSDINDKVQKELRKEILTAIAEDQDLGQRLVEEVGSYVGEELLAALAEEAVHLKFVFGQALSATRGWNKCDKNIAQSIEYLQERALAIHEMVFVGAAMQEVFPFSRPSLRSPPANSFQQSDDKLRLGLVGAAEYLITGRPNFLLNHGIIEVGKRAWNWWNTT